MNNNLNYCTAEVLKLLSIHHYINQREIASKLNISLGLVNSIIKNLKLKKYIDNKYKITEFGLYLIEKNKPECAIILSAGVGLRMIPINTSIPKGLINVNNEILIERLIKQLLEVNIEQIYIIVGYMKEKFEYLIDKYGVKLIVNPFYLDRNNLYSLSLAKNHLSNCYIVPSDLYFEKNPFNKVEINSWYLVSDRISKSSNVYLNKKHELVKEKKDCLKMIGLAYINVEISAILKNKLTKVVDNEVYNNCFWEELLYDKEKMIVYGKIIENEAVFEINTFEDLRKLDEHSSSLENSSLDLIAKVFDTKVDKIKNIKYLKKGMTNRSFLFDYENQRYIMRIPGEGTDQLINRSHEFDVYQKINSYKLSDEIIYMNSDNGYKITKFIFNARSCDPNNIEDLTLCMNFLKKFHDKNLKVDHYFDLYERIDFYENLRGKTSLYEDYANTKANIMKLKKFVDQSQKQVGLTHIDAVPDNFLIYEEKGIAKIKLIDWEYASMQDCHIDIAMFCIYSLYDKGHIDQLIDIYFENNCSRELRIKIYCFIAICGLLWSNWCEYKYTLGVEFGEYSLAQYRYAKDYYRIVMKEIEEENNA